MDEQKIPLGLTLRRFWGMVQPYNLHVIGVFIAIFLFEMSNLGEKLVFKLIIDQATAFDAGGGKEVFLSAMFAVVLIYAVIWLTRVLMNWLQGRGINRIESGAITDLKRKFFNHIITLSYNFHTTHRTGSLISRLTRGARAIERMMDVVFFNVTGTVIQFLGGFVALIAIYSPAALIILITCIIFVLFSTFMQTKQYPWNIHMNNAEDREKGNIGDFFANIDSIKYFGKEESINERYRELSENSRKSMVKAWSYWPKISAGQHAILGLGTFALVTVSTKAFVAGTIGLGSLVFIYTVYLGLLGPLWRFVGSMRDFYQATSEFENLYQYDAIKNEIVDKPNAKAITINKGTIEFNNVTFTYGHRKIFNRFSLNIKPGEKIAIVGSSGAGKSTLIKLIYRLYDPQKGSIKIDGIDIKVWKQESLRSELSIVPQECVLFDDSIYNNIAFSKLSATRDEVFDAIRFSQLTAFVKRLPQKENTIVGERGVKLSGGEKQRVSIARAILADKRILVLDEATSSLDSETEHEIQADLKRLMKNRTSIIIAHRLSTVMAADRIVVMEDGRIVQQGRHNQLIRQKGRYRALWELQKGGYI